MNNINLKAKLNGLDHLRALAIFLVFILHYQMNFGHPAWWPSFAKFGWSGVDLFFVLSGFLITSQLFYQIKQGKKISLKNFFLKRFFRILPAYLVVVTIYFFLSFFENGDSLPVFRFLTFTQNFGLDIKQYAGFAHSWSLCVEEHFYLLLPIMLLFLQLTNLFNKSYYFIIVLFLLGFLIRHFVWYNYYLPNFSNGDNLNTWVKYIYYPTYSRLDGLLAGVTIAGIYHFLPGVFSKLSKRGNQLLFISLVILTGAYFFCENLTSYHTSVFGFPIIAIGYGFLVLGAISPTSFLYKWNSKITSFIATLSYAIYLIHILAIDMAQQLFIKMGINKNGSIMILLCIIFCIAGALLLHLIIEKPFMKMRDRIIKRNNKHQNAKTPDTKEITIAANSNYYSS